MPSLVDTLDAVRRTYPKTQYSAPNGPIDFIPYADIILDEMAATELAEVVRTISVCYSGSISWAAFANQSQPIASGYSPPRPHPPRLEPAQHTAEALRGFLRGIIVARWHLLADTAEVGLPLDLQPPPMGLPRARPRGLRTPGRAVPP